MSLHVLRVPTRIASSVDVGRRWCFVCRKRVTFTQTVHVPTDPLSYYGPHSTLKCERGHFDGDCFPGTYREGADE
jgi:hypothetical protein